MPERKKRYSSRKDAETEAVKMAKAQLARLHRQYKIMEGSRLSYQAEMNVFLSKQR